ncbi:MAG: hypothetical protein MUF87_02985, partial [Anaerolineae bacterium]|jgi:hypothetical protein|nr:hypothetical protein [Anaerolineae bacterium]
MKAFFQGWTGSVVKAMKPKTVVLGVDETKLKAAFGVMVVGMVYEGGNTPNGCGLSKPFVTSNRTVGKSKPLFVTTPTAWHAGGFC